MVLSGTKHKEVQKLPANRKSLVFNWINRYVIYKMWDFTCFLKLFFSIDFLDLTNIMSSMVKWIADTVGSNLTMTKTTNMSNIIVKPVFIWKVYSLNERREIVGELTVIRQSGLIFIIPIALTKTLNLKEMFEKDISLGFRSVWKTIIYIW